MDEKPTTKKELVDVLKSYGFTTFKTWTNGVYCYYNKQDEIYAEVYQYTKGWWEVWLVGKRVPNTSTISYPGGTRKQTAFDLKILLNEILPF